MCVVMPALTEHPAGVQDVVEMQRGAVAARQRVLVVDDLLATGGTAAAAAALVSQLGAAATAFCFVVELRALGGRAQLPPSAAVFALVQR
jgi:adenine phosphoribosyltransferase